MMIARRAAIVCAVELGGGVARVALRACLHTSTKAAVEKTKKKKVVVPRACSYVDGDLRIKIEHRCLYATTVCASTQVTESALAWNVYVCVYVCVCT